MSPWSRTFSTPFAGSRPAARLLTPNWSPSCSPARTAAPLEALTPRELDVLTQMAEGRSNAGIARALVVSESAVAKHVNSIFTKLGLAASENQDNRRVLAVLHFLEV